MQKGCGRKIINEWWRFCGETDMGQTLPVLCKNCGGEYELADKEVWVSPTMLVKALKESLKLQSHYAELLNQYDGGERIVFKNMEEWLHRLETLDII